MSTFGIRLSNCVAPYFLFFPNTASVLVIRLFTSSFINSIARGCLPSSLLSLPLIENAVSDYHKPCLCLAFLTWIVLQTAEGINIQLQDKIIITKATSQKQHNSQFQILLPYCHPQQNWSSMPIEFCLYQAKVYKRRTKHIECQTTKNFQDVETIGHTYIKKKQLKLIPAAIHTTSHMYWHLVP